VFILTRPPTFRWVAASLLVVVAMWADLRPETLDRHPFLLEDVPAGTTVDATMIEMRSVVPGNHPPLDLPVVTQRPLLAGDPLTGGAASVPAAEVPDGWLLVELAVPAGAEIGATVVVVVSDQDREPVMISGVVTETGLDDGYGGEIAACAFPPDDAAAVAIAVGEQRASVLVEG
jgi:hypothetical protein